ncbi:MAG: MotA/TolQ/ExbB proton channel family protein [Nannocystaceae bacterium]
MTIVDHLVQVALLGATWVLYLLFALSLASFSAIFERVAFFRRDGRGRPRLRAELRRALAADDEGALRRALEGSSSVTATVLQEALPFRAGGSQAFLDAVDGALARERARLDRGATLLSTIGNNAPFVGLFGTVLGVIEAFSFLGRGDASAMDNVMSGIAEALVATAVGIFVAIPAVIGFNLAQKWAADVEAEVTAHAKTIAAWLRVSAGPARQEEAMHVEVIVDGRRG